MSKYQPTRLERFDDRVQSTLTRLMCWAAPKPRWVGWLACRAEESANWCIRVLMAHHNARILSDMEYRFGCVLNEVTLRMSKAYYDLDDMRTEIAECREWHCDEAVADEMEPLTNPRPFDKWHEDYGPVLWWHLEDGRIQEPPYCGTPLDDGWVADYYSHWTNLPEVVNPPEVIDADRA